MKKYLFILLIFNFNFFAKAQIIELNNPHNLDINYTLHNGTNSVKEKDSLFINFKVIDPKTGNEKPNFNFEIISGLEIGMDITENGSFSWQPEYFAVNAEEKKKIYQIVVKASNSDGIVLSKSVPIVINHTNRPPTINDLPPFFVKSNQNNTYQISDIYVYDEDKENIIFIPDILHLPEGLEMTNKGKITWKPSNEQFNKLKNEAIYLKFYVEDQPSKSQSEGKLKIMATQIDLPPIISVIPQNTVYKSSENQLINLRFYLSDPNGDETIKTFDFLSDNHNVPKESLIKLSNEQYEFRWKPDYNFVSDSNDSTNLKISFFAIDQTNKKEVKELNLTVFNALDQSKEDKKLYDLYKGTLERSWELIMQLEEKETSLKKDYNKAKKGKKSRSVVNASLGASTGLSSVVFKDNVDLQRGITTIGGTAVMTIGTLEATEVIGKSMKDITTSLNYLIEKKNEIQTKSDIFARNYADRINRRNKSFIKDVDTLMESLNLKGMVALELDATWEAPNKNVDKEIQKAFKDFKPDDTIQ